MKKSILKFFTKMALAFSFILGGFLGGNQTLHATQTVTVSDLTRGICNELIPQDSNTKQSFTCQMALYNCQKGVEKNFKTGVDSYNEHAEHWEQEKVGIGEFGATYTMSDEIYAQMIQENFVKNHLRAYTYTQNNWIGKYALSYEDFADPSYDYLKASVESGCKKNSAAEPPPSEVSNPSSDTTNPQGELPGNPSTTTDIQTQEIGKGSSITAGGCSMVSQGAGSWGNLFSLVPLVLVAAIRRKSLMDAKRLCYRFVLVLGFFGLLGASGRPVWAQGVTRTWIVDGVKREALVFSPAPTTTGADKHPLIFAFHGHGGGGQGTAQMMNLHNVWPQAIVVYPQGLPSLSYGNPQAPPRPGWQSEAGESGDRDLKFFDAMLASLKNDYAVDDDRIYSTGFSNGAMFTYLLWAERGATFAAFSVVAGGLVSSVNPSPALPVLVIAGEDDQTCPFTVQQDSIEKVRQLNGATGPGQACGPICTVYPSSTQTPVRTLIHPQGHVYPPWAGQATADFFKAHKL